MKKHLFIVLSILTFLLYSCDPDVKVANVTLDKSTLALTVNGTGKLVAAIQPSDAYGMIIWVSSNPSVATVANGIVTGISVGTAQIKATVGSYSATSDVTVSSAITSVTLSNSSLSLKVDSTQTITATLLPAPTAEITGNLVWTSTNPSVATVNTSGKITAVSDGTANIVASIGTVTAICSVTVYSSIPISLMGSNYYLINIDASSANILGSAKIVADYRPDGVTSNLFVWSNTYTTGTCNGTNFYGLAANWLSLVVGSVGWSGAAYNVIQGAQLDKLKAVTDDTSGKFYLHFAIKSSGTNSYEFQLGYGASAAIIVLGPNSMDNVAPSGNFTRNGQWQEVEIPVSVFKAKGLSYTTGMASTNVFAMLAGGTAGTKLEIDAVFIYKKP
jgi:hypothetical protein